jgi:LysM repeat protein
MNIDLPALPAYRHWRFQLMSLLGGVALLLAACGEPEPTPRPTAPPPTEAVVVTVPNVQAAQQVSATLRPVAVTVGATATPTPGATATITPCAAPPEWVEYAIQPGDTLTGLALASGVTVARLMQANCLADDVIRADATLYLPVAVELTPTPCSVKAGWPIYSVQPGDTLSGLAEAIGSNVEEIQAANCLNDTIIRLAQPLRLPRLPAVQTTSIGVNSSAEAAGAIPPVPAARARYVVRVPLQVVDKRNRSGCTAPGSERR